MSAELPPGRCPIHGGRDLAACDHGPVGPAELLEHLGAKMSPALSRPGPLRITSRDCVLCGPEQDCRCAEVEFGSAEYFARLDRLHGRGGAGR